MSLSIREVQELRPRILDTQRLALYLSESGADAASMALQKAVVLMQKIKPAKPDSVVPVADVPVAPIKTEKTR